MQRNTPLRLERLERAGISRATYTKRLEELLVLGGHLADVESRSCRHSTLLIGAVKVLSRDLYKYLVDLKLLSVC